MCVRVWDRVGVFSPNAPLLRPGLVGNLTSSELAHHWQRSVKFRLVWFYSDVRV